jgi:Icc-related predicted phosphoesterase
MQVFNQLRNVLDESQSEFLYAVSTVSTSEEESLPDMPTLAQAKNSNEWEHLWKPAIEKEMKNFMRHSKHEARTLEKILKDLDSDYKIVLLHYSPTTQTLSGEKKEIYPFLGCYYLAEAIDYGKADIAFHGHAHSGIEKGETPGGTPVRNVAQPVIRHAYNIYNLDKNSDFSAALNHRAEH